MGGTHAQATGQQSGTCLHSHCRAATTSTFFSFLKVCPCHLTPPLYFLCMYVCQHVCISAGRQRPWPFCPPIVSHFLWTPKECEADPLKNYGGFHRVITADEHLKWRTTKIPQCLSVGAETPEQSKLLKSGSEEYLRTSFKIKPNCVVAIVGKYILLLRFWWKHEQKLGNSESTQTTSSTIGNSLTLNLLIWAVCKVRTILSKGGRQSDGLCLGCLKGTM